MSKHIKPAGSIQETGTINKLILILQLRTIAIKTECPYAKEMTTRLANILDTSKVI